MSQEYTIAEVAAHSSKKDLYMIIHEKVYNASKFVDEHPGGEEVLLDVGGQDATEAFEDVGHSDEAREILDGLLIGELKRLSTDPKPKRVAAAAAPASGSSSGGLGFGLYIFVLLGGAAAYAAYTYLQKTGETKA